MAYNYGQLPKVGSKWIDPEWDNEPVEVREIIVSKVRGLQYIVYESELGTVELDTVEGFLYYFEAA